MCTEEGRPICFGVKHGVNSRETPKQIGIPQLRSGGRAEGVP